MHWIPVQVEPEGVDGQDPVPYCGAFIAEQGGGALHTRLDQTPLVHVSVVEPDATPKVHDTVQVPPLLVCAQDPLP